jgi:hypothetical protein
MPRVFVVSFLFVGIFLTALRSPAQVTKHTKVSTLVAQSIAILTNGNVVNDAVVNANATLTAGSATETGTAKLELSGSQLSRFDLTLETATHSEVRNDSAGFPDGAWADTDGTWYQMPADQCWTPGAWFSPLAWLLTASGADGVVSYVANETYNGVAVDHLQVYRAIPATQPSSVTNLLQKLSTFDIYLDSTSHLPVAVTFSTHPSGNSGSNVPAAVQFSNYQNVNGVLLPYRIQRFLQNTLYLDIAVTGATINSDLSRSDFQLQGVTQ